MRKIKKPGPFKIEGHVAARVSKIIPCALIENGLELKDFSLYPNEALRFYRWLARATAWIKKQERKK